MNRLAAGLRGRVLTSEADLLSYSYDGALERWRPDAVVLARSAEDVRRSVLWCVENGAPYVARGAGTNLSGGCVPLRGGVVISLAGMDRILAVDTGRRTATVEPGVVNLNLQKELEKTGFFYAPDPASYRVCTLGGNIGENAGGPRCLKYGVTTNHVAELEAVMPDGSLERFSLDDDGPEILSLLIGAEGTLGIVTRAKVSITPLAPSIETMLAAFPSLEAAMACVSDIVASGILPRVLEAMDRMTVESIEAYVPAGYPRAEAVLLIEVEGTAQRAALSAAKVMEVCRRHGGCQLRRAAGEAERTRLWEGRRSAYAALSRLAPNVLAEDGVVPRGRLAEAAARMREIASGRKVSAALLFHAGDGNLHPNIVFDERDAGLTERVKAAGFEMLAACVELGGSISGEHGIGTDKRAAMGWLFSEPTLELFRRIKRALDPEGLANPDKLFPLAGERMPVSAPKVKERPLSDAARALVERARASRGPLAVAGTGSKSRPPADALSTRALDRVLALERSDYTVTVEAGISPVRLLEEVEAAGCRLALPPLRGTLGGLLATRPWPGLRDSVLGMRILLADGTVAEVGSRVVKSVAGYDVPRLLLGSWGTLAIILEATLKLSPERLPVPDPFPAPRPFSPGPWHRRLKAAFDPENRLNAWVHDHAR